MFAFFYRGVPARLDSTLPDLQRCARSDTRLRRVPAIVNHRDAYPRPHLNCALLCFYRTIIQFTMSLADLKSVVVIEADGSITRHAPSEELFESVLDILSDVRERNPSASPHAYDFTQSAVPHGHDASFLTPEPPFGRPRAAGAAGLLPAALTERIRHVMVDAHSARSRSPHCPSRGKTSFLRYAVLPRHILECAPLPSTALLPLE